ncbi:MAG: hypothetical protein IK002_02345 [Treponema sp.]|uniref:putative glycoside hydrolase n=1 Tax=Treponema sp. TaxID=166 RepID=UPI00298E75A4|nr:putative glycoside hydrolase [Treponema sp.]MBR5932804.1 hypothetical protein [Treponema sp.]
MKILLVLMASFFIPSLAFAREGQKELKPLYALPKVVPEKSSSSSRNTIGNDLNKPLLATESGIYRVINTRTILPLWTEGKAKQILKIENIDNSGKGSDEFFFVTSEGILFSRDLNTFEKRNEGLPVLTIKKYENKEISFVKQVADIKDISYNPEKPNQMVCATKDKIYFSEDSGLTWKYYDAPRVGSSGIKAVAVATLRVKRNEEYVKEDYIFCSHATLGLFYSKVGSKTLNTITAGLAGADPNVGSDEVSDILPVLCKTETGDVYTEVFLSQTFMPRIYRLDFDKKKSICIYKGTEPADTIDGLYIADSSIIYMSPKTINAFEINPKKENSKTDKTVAKFKDWKNIVNLSPSPVFAAWIPQSETGYKSSVVLNELWLINSEQVSSPYANQICDQKSLYIPCYQAYLPNGIEKFKKIILDNDLNSLVIDMKDDYGLLRYNSNDPEILKKGKVSQYAVNLEKFVSEFKKDNIYMIARIVVFKDRNLSLYDNGKYAVWNKASQKQWLGIRGYETDAEGKRVPQYYDEYWVDPFCPEVWEYDVAIAKELIARGFDEIQFDYIRFPTDGININNATFRYQSNGMDRESALISFLAYARKNIDAPIGIDIYGANGWYRTGARTGQDVEMLAEYVDVICPMFYPSHFENQFLNYEPYEERPYRIYFYGTYRNTIIARNKIVVRPWVQTFFLNVPYDQKYYDAEYVRKEMYGVRDSVNRGYMHWNNGGNYSKLSPDPADSLYKGKAYEADPKYRKPAIGKKEENPIDEAIVTGGRSDQEAIEIWENVLNQDNL